MQKIAILNTRACTLTVASLLFVFVVHGAGTRRATYLCLDSTKNVDKNWNINNIISLNFDHAWAEDYFVTLKTRLYGITIIKESEGTCVPSENDTYAVRYRSENNKRHPRIRATLD